MKATRRTAPDNRALTPCCGALIHLGMLQHAAQCIQAALAIVVDEEALWA
jgi:hypothetical protein